MVKVVLLLTLPLLLRPSFTRFYTRGLRMSAPKTIQRIGKLADTFVRACGCHHSRPGRTLSALLALLVLTGLFVEVKAQSGVSVTMTASDGDPNGDVVEGATGSAGYKTITISLGRALTGSETVTVPLTVVGAVVATDYAFVLQPTSQSGVSLNTSGSYSAQDPAVVFAAGASSATLRLTPVNKSSGDTQLAVTIDFGTVTQTGVPGGVDTPTGAPVSVIIVNDELLVPGNWPLKPDGVGEHDTFRLLFVTRGNPYDAIPTDIGTYNGRIHTQIVNDLHGGAAHTNVKDVANFFRVVGCTASVSARVNTVMNHGPGWVDGSTSATSSGVPIYWLNGNKLADNYFDFYDGSWDDETGPRSHTGGSVSRRGTYTTGCNDDGTSGSSPMGDDGSTTSHGGWLNHNSGTPLHGFEPSKFNSINHYYGISPVFKVGEPFLEFSSASFSAAEDAGTGSVTVKATAMTKTALTVNYTVTGGSAVAGTDYTTLSGSFTFPAGVSSADLEIAITDDIVPENNETITLRLDAGTGYELESQTTTTFTIEANDTVTASLSSDHYTFLENIGNAAIPVELNHAAPFDVQVTLTPTDGTATSADYDNSAVSSTIPMGSTSVDINIPITNDSTRESTVRDEEFTVALTVTARSGLVLGRSAATVVIADDDCSFGMVIRGVSSSDPIIDEGDSFTYYVRPCSDPGSAQTVTITGHDGTNLRVDTDPDTAGEQNTLEFDSSNWYIQREVRIWAPQDNDARGGSYNLNASGFGGFSVSDVTVVEDEIPVELLVERNSVNEGDRIEVTVRVAQAWTGAVNNTNVPVGTHDDNTPNPIPCPDGTADANDYTLQRDHNGWKFFSIPPAPATERTKMFIATADNNDEGPETVTICIARPTGAQHPYGVGHNHREEITIFDAVTAEADGSYTTPHDWALKPSGLAPGTKFRLVFASSGRRDSTSTDIDDYNDFVRSEAGSADAHAAIRPYSGTFTALASTASVDARDNTSTTGAGEAIYWLGGAKAADNYADLYDGSWDDRTAKNEKGDTDGGYRLVWTGSNANGTKHSSESLGATPRVAVGNVNSAWPPILYTGAPNNDRARTQHHRLYGLSPVFTVGAAPEFEVSITPGTSPVTEGTDATFTVTSTPPPATDLTVNLTVAQTSDFGATPIGSQTVTIPTTGSAAFTVSTGDDTVDDADGSVSVTVETGSGYTVSSTTGSAMVTVNDDDATPTAITLSVDDSSVSEDDSPAPVISVTATVDGSTQFGVAKTVTVSVTPLADTTSTNYVDMTAVSNFGITIPAGATSHSQSFTLTPDDDVVDETDNTVTVSGSISGDSATTISSVPITLADDDATPTAITLTASPSTITENGGGQTITVTAAVSGTTFGVAKTVAVSVAGHDTAGKVQFGQVSNFNINIAAEAASEQGQFTLTPTNNNTADNNGEATIAGTLGGATVTGTSVTITNDDTASLVSVPIDWALKPADFEGAEGFRLLFVTSTGRDAQSTDIADYNTFVQNSAKAGHSAITDAIGDQFKVLGSTAAIDARDNTGTIGTGVPIYWLNGEKVADDYADFYDGNWDSSQFRYESGNAAGGVFSIWTGSNADGTKHNRHLGNSSFVRYGDTRSGRNHLSDGATLPDNQYHLYALSPAFKVANPTTVWIRGSVTVNVCELNGSEVPASVCENDNNSAERKQCEAAWTPAWAKPGATPLEQVSQADINAARASVAAICGHNASASYVQERHGRDEITVTEGGAAGEITVGLSKKLGAGETVTVPLTASGVANGDYTIALKTGAGINTGVALNTSNPYSAARPAVAFTGHATNEVRFASLNVSGVSDSANEGSETLTLGIGTVTNTNLTAGTQLHSSFQTARVRIRDAGAGLQTGQAPTEAVANVQVMAVDDTSASVTWDAVEHATSYDVSWSAESSDSLNASAGAETVTGTTVSIRHDASVAMTLTVTVTPEYVDENGETQQLDALAGTATIEVGPADGLIGGGGGTNGSGDGDAVQAGEGEALGAAAFPIPKAHWRLDGDALDWAGSSHGMVGGGAAFATNEDGSGVGSHALVLDGSDDYVDLASHVSNFPLGDAARTVTGWFKADAGNQRQTFLTYGPSATGQRFSVAADRTQVLVGVSGHSRGVNGLDLSDGWHHVAVTYAGGDSDGISIYLDGALQPASTLVGAPQPVDTRTGPAAIGRSASGAAHYAGSIDDVRIYDVALSAEQVLALFNEHPQTPPPVTTAVTASASPALAEGNLDGADVELTLDAGAFAATVGTSDISASGVSGVGVSSVTRDSDGQVTATLAFDSTDFDADATLMLTVSAAALAHSDTALSATLPVAAVDEPPPPPAVLIPAPLAHWKFDDNADDSAGSSNGAVRNGASFTTAASVGSHALSLDGSDDHVDLATHVSSFPLGNSARSVTGWFRADAGNQRQTFLTYGPNVEGKRLSIAADRTQAVVAVSGHAWGVNNLNLSDGWHHVAVTFPGGDSDDFSIYLNGAMQSASTLGGIQRQVDTRKGTAAIGRSVSGTAHYGGEIDDVRLYDYALSAKQVRAIAGRQETASVQDGAQAIAAMPGSLLPAALALPRAGGGADGTGTGGFDTDGFGASLTTASSSPVHAPLLPSASNPLREGLVRIVNPSAQPGEVRIVAIDDAGWRSAPLTLAIGAGASAQFTSRDLEWGNAAMGLNGATGPGTGDWRLEVSSGLDIEVLPYARTADGILSAMADVAPVADNVHSVALFNPADSADAASKLRLTNRGAQALRANITGIDDTGLSPGGMVSVEIEADESVLLTAAELEAGGSNLLGALGDGEGQWRLDIASDGDLAVMNLIETSDGHLTNLSNATTTSVPAREVHVVDRFPSSSDICNEQGVVRIVNSTESPALVRIEPNDSTGWRYPPLTLTLGANEAANLGTWDLELGNATKGLSGSAGPGAGGAWRLVISSDSDIELLTYTRTANGLLNTLPGDAETKDNALSAQMVLRMPQGDSCGLLIDPSSVPSVGLLSNQCQFLSQRGSDGMRITTAESGPNNGVHFRSPTSRVCRAAGRHA